MGVDELRSTGERLLAQARAVRDAYPDEAAMRAIEITPLAAGTGCPNLRAALRYLWDEVGLIRAGRAGGIGVLDDEIAAAERELVLLGE